jgi:hypothetical protein
VLCTERAVVLFLVLIDGCISNSAFSSWYMVDEASSLARDKQRYARTRRWPVDVSGARGSKPTSVPARLWPELAARMASPL